MSDVILSDGRQVNIDLSKITLGDWRELIGNDQKKSDAILCRVTGLTQKELTSMLYLDSRQLFEALFKKAREPLSDPQN